jgi:hypothetical protein
MVDVGPGLAATLARLVSSPRVQYLANSFKHTLPQMSGPFQVGSPSHSIGAAPHNNAAPTSHNGVGLGSTLGSLAGAVAKSMTAPQDPMQALYNQLLDQLQQPVAMPQSVNTADLMRQVRSAIDPIYNQQEATARKNADYATSSVNSMYHQLADMEKKQAPEAVKQAKDAQAQVAQLYGQLRSNIEGSYSRVSQEQGDQFKQLGIESALPDVLDKQNPAVTDALTAASQDQASEQQAYLDKGQADASYYSAGAPISVMRGNEISTDLLSQLQDYIQKSEADRTSGIQSSYTQLLGQANSQLAQAQGNAQQEASRRQQMLWQILSSQMNNNAQSAKLTPDSFMSSLPQNVQQGVAGAFTRLERSPEAIYGKVQDPRSPVPGTFVQTTPEWYLSQADKMYQQGQIDASTHQALLMYLQLYNNMGTK